MRPHPTKLYDLLSDPLEVDGLLSAVLSPEQNNNYLALRQKLIELSNAAPSPVILGYAAAPGQFSVTVQRAEGSSYSIWGADDLTNGPWTQITDFVIEVSETTVQLTDPKASGSGRFYRVGGEAAR